MTEICAGRDDHFCGTAKGSIENPRRPIERLILVASSGGTLHILSPFRPVLDGPSRIYFVAGAFGTATKPES